MKMGMKFYKNGYVRMKFKIWGTSYVATLNVKITLNVKKNYIKGKRLTLNVKTFYIKG